MGPAHSEVQDPKRAVNLAVWLTQFGGTTVEVGHRALHRNEGARHQVSLGVLVRIGKDAYFLSADGNLMPSKKDQPPPNLRYFKRPQR